MAGKNKYSDEDVAMWAADYATTGNTATTAKKFGVGVATYADCCALLAILDWGTSKTHPKSCTTPSPTFKNTHLKPSQEPNARSRNNRWACLYR